MAPLRFLSAPRRYRHAPRPTLRQAVGALVVTVAAAAGGWWLEGVLAPPVERAPEPAPLTVHAGAAQALVRAGWRPAPLPRLPGIDPRAARALGPADGSSGRLVVALLPAGDHSLLPPALLQALSVPLGDPARTKLGGRPALAYRALTARGVRGLLDVVAAPTSAGVVTLACLAPVSDPLPAGSCPDDVLAVDVRGAAALAPDPASALRTGGRAALAALNRARLEGRTALRRAHTPQGQAGAATRLSDAYRTAASTLAPLAPTAGAGTGLPHALEGAATAYARLAAAADRRDGRAWQRARAGAHAAEQAVAAQVTALRAR